MRAVADLIPSAVLHHPGALGLLQAHVQHKTRDLRRVRRWSPPATRRAANWAGTFLSFPRSRIPNLESPTETRAAAPTPTFTTSIRDRTREAYRHAERITSWTARTSSGPEHWTATHEAVELLK